MMLLASHVKDHLKTVFPAVQFYVGTINKNDKQCVSIYPRGSSPFKIAAGGLSNTTMWYLPLSVLVHWSEDTTVCETKAAEIYEYFVTAENTVINGTKIIHFEMKDSSPVDLKRDEKNICEMVIRLDVIYENHIEER